MGEYALLLSLTTIAGLTGVCAVVLVIIAGKIMIDISDARRSLERIADSTSTRADQLHDINSSINQLRKKGTQDFILTYLTRIHDFLIERQDEPLKQSVIRSELEGREHVTVTTLKDGLDKATRLVEELRNMDAVRKVNDEMEGGDDE